MTSRTARWKSRRQKYAKSCCNLISRNIFQFLFLPFSWRHKYFWDSLQELPFCSLFQHVSQRRPKVFGDKVLGQMNKFPTARLQNSTCHFCWRIFVFLGLLELSIWWGAEKKKWIKNFIRMASRRHVDLIFILVSIVLFYHLEGKHDE